MPDRREFLKQLVGGVALAGAARTWPFRVYSFPSEIKLEPASWLSCSYEWWSRPEAFDIRLVPPRGTDPKLEAQIRTLVPIWRSTPDIFTEEAVVKALNIEYAYEEPKY